MTKVFDMRTGTYSAYKLSPRSAVISAHAQRDCRDFNTWDYEKVYGERVVVSECVNKSMVLLTIDNQTTMCRREFASMSEAEYSRWLSMATSLEKCVVS